nr:integrase, catalytic region, zinc finger, CCHC-type, peptidase aspartic, catalytic [Tanacetum cinerariifolium]
NSTLHALQDDLILAVIEQLKTQVVKCTKINQDNKQVNELLTAELERYRDQERVLNELKHDDKASTSYKPSQEIEFLKHTLSEHLKEKESLEQKITILKNDFQKEESRNIDRELALEKQAQQLKPKLYDGRIIEKSDVVVIPDTEETLMLAEESRLKMIEKQNNPQMTEKKVITKPIDYAILNQLSTDFETRFVPQTELSEEQAFCLQKKVLVITTLKEQLNKLKGKAVLTEAVSLNPINPELLKVDVVPLVPKLRKNRTSHTDYIRHTQDEAATLREIIESERLISPLNTSFDYACKYTRQIQELLMILQQTCPSLTELGTKLVAVTPKNKTKQIRPTEQITKSRKTTVTTPPSASLDSNTPVLSSTGVILVSSASGSIKSKSVKTPVKRKVWKTTRNVFKTVGHIWKPTGRTFTLVGNVGPLTRIPTPIIVPPREPIPIVNSTDKPIVILVYTRKPKAANNKVPNKLEPNNSWGSSSFNVPSSLLTCRNDHVAKIMAYGDYQIGNVTISRVYYVEGLGHNLFSVGQFCDSDLEVAFRQHTCFIRNLDGVDLLTGSRGNNLYTLSLQD